LRVDIDVDELSITVVKEVFKELVAVVVLVDVYRYD
jgi:hypothetical protein